jgi:tetratricopeptide (TPR) repeat protein
MRRATPLALLSVLYLLIVVPSSADTIVLKNGRHIVAQSVTEEGDRVSYETPAGRLSIPKSIVARIDRNDFGASSFGRSSEPPVTPPQVDPAQGYDDVAHGAVRDGSVDFAYLAKLENDAHGGDSTAVAKVAAAHHAAAQFLLRKGDVEAAADHYRRALTFAPTNVGLLLNLAVLRLRQSQYSEAMDPLERAQRVAPDSSDVPKLMGWAYYGQNKIDQAVEQWKRSVRLRPDAEVQRALEKAERDRQEEQSYREGETAHFALKYFGGATPDLARGVLRALEEDYRDIESQLDYTPRDQIGVILYTEQSFVDITRAPGWAGAINDGRIRVPVQGLSTVTGELNRVLRHELTHSFVTQKTRGRCPTWLQEGIAQWMEGRRSGESASALVAAYDAKGAPSLANLEGSWMSFSGNAAAFAYAWSLAATESIIQAGGVSDISRLLDHIAVNSTEDALRETLRTGYAELDQQTATFLRKEYLR